MPDDGRVPLRAIRVPDETWDAAKVAAEKRGESVSQAVREFLERYGKRHK